MATLDIALIACRDTVLANYFIGLNLLEQALEKKVCGGDVSSKQIDKSIKPFIRLLIDKIGELNYRSRDISMSTLIKLFRHPSIEIRVAIEGIMDITEKPPGPAEAKWRLVTARL